VLNGEFYIGFTTKSPHTRFTQHCEPGNKKNNHFHNAIHKYGKQNFTVTVLEMGENREYGKNVAEKLYIKWLKPQYNKTEGGDGVLGQAGTKNPFYGKRHTEETRKLLSQKCKGRKHTPEERAKQSLAQIGKPRKKSKPPWNKGIKTGPISDEHRAKLKGRIVWNKGIKTGMLHSEEWKQYMSAKMTGRAQRRTQTRCPHCQKVGSTSNMKRYHFDKCKKPLETHI
jgi:group I intron endonuclease